MDQETESRIRLLAYELWLAADRPEGSHLRFWTEAEKLIAAFDHLRPSGPATDAIKAMDEAISKDRRGTRPPRSASVKETGEKLSQEEWERFEAADKKPTK